MITSKQKFIKAKERALRLIAEIIECDSVSLDTIEVYREYDSAEVLAVAISLAKLHALAAKNMDRPVEDILREINGTADELEFRYVTSGMEVG